MGITDFFRGFFDKDNRIRNLKSCSHDIDINTKYKILILESSIELISKTVARAEFQTFLKGKEDKGNLYYTFNVEPNRNKSATIFWQEVMRTLLTKGEALIIVQKHKLYLATSFNREERAFLDNIYTDVVIGDYELSDTWYENQVLYLKYDNEKIRAAIDAIYNDFSKLIASSIKGYQNSKSRKGKLKIPTNLPKELEEEKALQNHLQESMKDFMDPEKDAAYIENDGFEYTELTESKGSKSNDSGRETKNFINDIFDFIAIGLGIPPSLLKGDTVNTKDAVNNFLTFCINPIARIPQDEINRKMYGQKEYLSNSYVKVDTTNIKAVDLRDIANSIDLLNRNGALTIDDTLRTLGKEPIGGDLGAMRFITKNLELLDKVLEEGQIGNIERGD
ncbi:phage portal protein [Tissierella pigra]|uniref:phage portal protein n=1 Tax=Tissierella pigra TaxID=2607614 RepID=UPI001C0FF1DE|nr:phage portal protein [Tissierella pigra]